ncbi:MAG: hypothetical protein WB902_06580 [Acetobacteraceae bacterium]
MGDTIAVPDVEARRKDRVTYLLETYKLYHGHINTMFNYFLVLAALIANAYIQSMQKQAAISSNVSTSIAVFEALISWVALLIHKRSRALLDTIETGLGREEDILFPNGTGFLNVDVGYRPPLARHRYQFPFTYWAFVIGFMIMAGYSSGYLQVVSDWLAQHT